MSTMAVQRNLTEANIPPTDTVNTAGVGVNSTTNLLAYNSNSTKFVPSVTLSSQFSISGVGNGADTTDDTLFTYSVPAGFLATNGQGIRVRAFGTSASNGNNKTVKIIYGATTVATSGVVTINNKSWSAEAVIVRSAATTQLAVGTTLTDTTMSCTKSAPGETLSGAVVVKVTGASGTSGAANDLLGNSFIVESVGL